MIKNPIVNVVLTDVAPAVAAYYGCRAFGASEYLALLAAAGVGFLRVLYVALRQRKFDGFAAFTGTVFGLGLALSFIAGDPRLLLAVKSVTSAVAGLIFLGTCFTGRPAGFAVAKRFGAEDEETAQRWEVLYREVPAFRRVYLVMTVAWGVGLLAESVIRLPLVYLLPVDVAAGLSPVLLIGTIALLSWWSAWYGRRGEQAASTVTRQGEQASTKG